MRKGELESRLLVLVTLGLVAFGLVMVYSATSAAAALGNADPSSYLKRQAVYALLGVALLIGASRFDYRRLKAVAPGLVLSSLVLCALVLVAGTRVNGARRWLSLGPTAFQPSELAQLASVGVLLNIAGGHAGARRAAVPDRGRRDGGTRPAGARRGGGAPRPRRERDVRRVAGSRRGAARSRGGPPTRPSSALPPSPRRQ